MPLGLGWGRSGGAGVHKQIVNVDIDAKLSGGWSSHFHSPFHSLTLWTNLSVITLRTNLSVITRMLVSELWFHGLLRKMGDGFLTLIS